MASDANGDGPVLPVDRNYRSDGTRRGEIEVGLVFADFSDERSPSA